MPNIETIVRNAKRIAVVGWSPDPARPSHDVASYLFHVGYEIIPVNPQQEGLPAYGHKVVRDLESAGPVDVALIFRRSEQVGEHEADAVRAKVPVFWMQSGIRNAAVAARLKAKGIAVVEDECFKVQHRVHARA